MLVGRSQLRGAEAGGREGAGRLGRPRVVGAHAQLEKWPMGGGALPGVLVDSSPPAWGLGVQGRSRFETVVAQDGG